MADFLTDFLASILQEEGVSWDSRLQKWRARIAFKGSNISLGVFNRADLAADAYRAKAKELHGEFAFFGDH